LAFAFFEEATKMKKNIGQSTKPQLQILIVLTAVMLGGLIVHRCLRTAEAAPQDNCAAITNQINGLESERASLQKDLQKAAGSEKQQMMNQIKQINQQIQQKQAELKKCPGGNQSRSNQPEGPQGEVMRWTVDKDKREALVFVPTTDMAVKRPLVFAFHGHGGNMQGTAQQMHIQSLWPEAIVVYPQGLPTKSHVDPQGIRPGWQQTAGTDGDRDLKFFDEMVSTLKQKYLVADDRIYTTGFSNGAVFSYLLWAERANVIAAIGEVAGRLFNPPEHLTQPRPILAIAGIMDTTDLFALQRATIDNDDRPVDSATGQGQQCPVPSGAASGTSCTLFTSTTHTPVKTLIHPGAHVYPSWAPEEIVKFFKNHKQT
jgi:polyhydroxybutyrate depolymerase